MNELALFSGAGGGILGGTLLGWRTVCTVELDPFCRWVLVRRQNEGILPSFPIWDDVRTFDGRPWRGTVDVVSGGFPCQGISKAGKGSGLADARSGLWSEMARIIGEVRPRYVFVENAPMLTLRGLDRVLGDLSEMGFDAEWGVVGAHHVAAPHERERLYLLAHADRVDGEERVGIRAFLRTRQVFASNNEMRIKAGRWMEAVRRNAGSNARDPHRVDRTRAIGNGQVPTVAALAWRILTP